MLSDGGCALVFSPFLTWYQLQASIMESSPLGSSSPPHYQFMALSQCSSPSSMSKSFPTTFNVSHHFPTTMDKPTYLCWRSQFLDVLAIHDLSHVISPDFVPPAPPETPSSPSLEYVLWLKTIASSIQTIIISYVTARDGWDLLSKHLSAVSKIHIHILRDQLHTLKKTAHQAHYTD